MAHARRWIWLALIALTWTGCDTTGAPPVAPDRLQQTTGPQQDSSAPSLTPTSAAGPADPAFAGATTQTPVGPAAVPAHPGAAAGRSTPVAGRPAGQQQTYPAPQTVETGQQQPSGEPAGAPQEPAPAPAAEVTDAQAAALISAFALEYLGIEVTVGRVVAARGAATLPRQQQNRVAAAQNIADVRVGGIIDFGYGWGGGTVAVAGDPGVSPGQAALGAFSITAPEGTPTDAAAALLMVQRAFPALADLPLEQHSDESGYLFTAITTLDGADQQSAQPAGVQQTVLAGTFDHAGVTIVWAVIGIGPFAEELRR